MNNTMHVHGKYTWFSGCRIYWMENTLDGKYIGWRIYWMENILDGEYIMDEEYNGWRIHWISNILNGEYSGWRMYNGWKIQWMENIQLMENTMDGEYSENIKCFFELRLISSKKNMLK